MANRGPEPTSRRVQLSDEYIRETGKTIEDVLKELDVVASIEEVTSKIEIEVNEKILAKEDVGPVITSGTSIPSLNTELFTISPTLDKIDG